MSHIDDDEKWETEAILNAPPAAPSVDFVSLSQKRENSSLKSSSIITDAESVGQNSTNVVLPIIIEPSFAVTPTIDLVSNPLVNFVGTSDNVFAEASYTVESDNPVPELLDPGDFVEGDQQKNIDNNNLLPHASNNTIPIATNTDPILLSAATIVTENSTICNIPDTSSMP
jgi:hypothetical protein